MFSEQLGAAIASATRPAQLDQLATTLWRAYANGAVGEADAQVLGDLVQARRTALGSIRTAVQSLGPMVACFTRLRPQRPPDRARSIERRRRLAASGPLPPQLAAQFTTSELAVLRIVGDEVRDHGQCDRCLDEIAARAGVCRRTAQTTLRLAERLGLVGIEERPRPGRKHLPNLVRVVSREWQAWLDRGPRRRSEGIGCKKSHAPDTAWFSKGKRGEFGCKGTTRGYEWLYKGRSWPRTGIRQNRVPDTNEG